VSIITCEHVIPAQAGILVVAVVGLYSVGLGDGGRITLAFAGDGGYASRAQYLQGIYFLFLRPHSFHDLVVLLKVTKMSSCAKKVFLLK
jgi:hypothetical protein